MKSMKGEMLRVVCPRYFEMKLVCFITQRIHKQMCIKTQYLPNEAFLASILSYVANTVVNQPVVDEALNQN